MTEDGCCLFFSEARDRWLLILQVDLPSQSVTSQISLQTPEPIGRYSKFFITEETYCIVGEEHFLELDREDWSIARWRSLRELVPETAIIETTFLVPGSSCLWMSFRAHTSSLEETHIVDVDSWRANRRLEKGYFAPFSERDQPGVFSYHEHGRVFSANGVPNTDLELPWGWEVHAVTAGTEDRYLWLTLVRLDLPDESESSRVEVVEFDRQGRGQDRFRRLLRLDAFEDTGFVMASDSDAGIGFIIYQSPEVRDDHNLWKLVAFSRDRKAVLYDVPIPSEAVLVQDWRARHVALVCSRDPVTMASLGPHPPAMDLASDQEPSKPSRALSALHAPLLNGPTAPEVNAAVLAMAGSFAGLSASKIALKIEEMARKEMQVDIACLALRRLHPEASAWQSLVQTLARERSEDVGLALIAATADSDDAEWE